MSRAAVVDYNEALERYFVKYEDHLERSHEIFEVRDRTLKLNITVENSGQESAEDVDVVLRVDETLDGIWLDEWPDGSERVPKPPDAPRGTMEPIAAMSKPVPVQNIRSLLEPRDNAVIVPMNYEPFHEAKFDVHRVNRGFR